MTSCYFEQWCKHTCTCIAYWNSCSRCYSLAFCWLSRQVAPSVVNDFSSQSTHFQRLSFPFNIRYSIPYCHCKHGFLRHRLGIQAVPDTTGRHQCFKTHDCKGVDWLYSCTNRIQKSWNPDKYLLTSVLHVTSLELHSVEVNHLISRLIYCMIHKIIQNRRISLYK